MSSLLHQSKHPSPQGEAAEKPQGDASENWINSAPINPELARYPKGIYNSQATALQLGQKIGSGGEGTIYEIQGQPDFVAKLYHEPPAPEKVAKIIALALRFNERLAKFSAWPVDVLRERPDGAVIGFVMQKIGHAAEVHTLHSPKSRLQKFPEASWAFLVHAATNIARAVAAMHEHHFVVGDLNPKNILITKQATVYILDCDSFQVNIDGKVYRCDAGFPDYTPPELQGVPFRSLDRTQEHDCFGLGIVIFQLLFLGRHPFSGRFLGVGEMPLEKAIGEMRFAFGEDAGKRQMQAPPGTLPMTDLPPEIGELFQRAFLQKDRPNPNEWIAPLEKLAQSLQRCTTHNGHLFWQEAKSCPWCEIEGRSRVRLFNILGGGKDAQRNAFRLDEIWREIERVQQRTDLTPLKTYNAETVQISDELAPLANRRDRRMALLVFIGIGAGIGIGLLNHFWLILLLLTITLVFFWRVSKLSAEEPISLIGLWRNFALPSVGVLGEKYQQVKKEADARVKELSAKWKAGSTEESFTNKIEEFARKKELLETFSEFRQSRHRQLEEKIYTSKLEQYLRQFPIEDHPHATQKTITQLHKFQIKTAADLTRPKMRDITKIDEKFLRDLMQWREARVRQLQFSIADVPKTERARVETELDELQNRLEIELSSAPFYLRQLQEDIEKRARKIKPELEWFLFQSAQMQKNLAVLTKKVMISPAVVALFICLFFSVTFINAVNPRSIIDNIDRAQIEKKAQSYQSFQGFFNQGLNDMEAKNWTSAKTNFLSAITEMNEQAWTQEYTELYYQLAVARKHLGELKAFNDLYPASVNASPEKEYRRLQLAISHVIAGNKKEAVRLYDEIKDEELKKSMSTVLEFHEIAFP